MMTAFAVLAETYFKHPGYLPILGRVWTEGPLLKQIMPTTVL